MFAADPERTPWDVNFRFAGFPVRIHPFFWLMGLFFGAFHGRNEPILLVLIIGCVFVSILVHEMGHAIAFRRLGIESHIVLYGMGGLCVPYREPWRMVSRAEFPWNSIAIAFAGPLAGFVLAGVVALFIYIVGVSNGISQPLFFVPSIHLVAIHDDFWSLGGQYGTPVLNALLFFNIFWGLLNLLPVWPLDGGRISRALFQLYGRGQPIRDSLMVSLLFAIGMVVWAGFQHHFFIMILFGMLAFNNYREFQVGAGGMY